MKILTGNDLASGAVTWWAGSYWSIHVEDAVDVGEGGDANEARLRSVSVPPGAAVVGRALGEMRLDECGVTVSAVRRRGIRALSPGVETRIEAGDVVVLLGGPTGLEAAEQRLLGG